jgi:hypothetical protein
VLKGKFHRGDADLDVALKMISHGVPYSEVGHLIEVSSCLEDLAL